MTARDLINRRKRWLLIAVVLGVTLFIAAVVLAANTGQGELYLLVIPGFAIMLLTLFWGQFSWFRCPWCQENLSPLAFQRLGGLSQRVKFCPYCGHEVDDELPNGESVLDDDPF